MRHPSAVAQSALKLQSEKGPRAGRALCVSPHVSFAHAVVVNAWICALQNEAKAPKSSKHEEKDEEDDEEDEHGDTLCGICGGLYGANEFWIGCDHCDKW